MKIKETFELAFQNHKNNNLEIAEKLYKEIIEKDPNHFGSAFYLGTLSMQNKNFEEAIKWYEKAIKINPNFPDAYNNLGTIFQNLKKYENAITYYEKAAKVNQNYPDALNNLGTIKQIFGNLEEAISLYEKAITINPKFSSAYNNLASVLNEIGKPKKAIENCEKAIQINPDYASAYNNLGNAYKKLKDFQKAIECYEKVLQINPEYINANNNLGAIFRDLGNPGDAKKYFKKIDTTSSRGELLECVYFSENLKNYETMLENLVKKDPLNLRVATIAAYVAKKENIKNIYPFCKDPLNFVFTKNIKNEFGTADEYLKKLLNTLDRINSVWEPTSYTTKGGYQSTGNLFESNETEINKLIEIFEKQIDSYRATYKNEKDFFVTKWPNKTMFRGWHVKLLKQGYQNSHIHPAGWLSGVFYLKVPEQLNNNEGSIEFTLYGYDYPNHKNLPNLFHKPKSFDLALFPSSLFHRTIPFNVEDERHVIAFDLIPK
tara:strand:+ start:456 stop:1922 length:1467 start_codon:yes stop_codon:yes gene_type:complete